MGGQSPPLAWVFKSDGFRCIEIAAQSSRLQDHNPLAASWVLQAPRNGKTVRAGESGHLVGLVFSDFEDSAAAWTEQAPEISDEAIDQLQTAASAIEGRRRIVANLHRKMLQLS